MSEENVQIARRGYAGFARAVEMHRSGQSQDWRQMPEWEDLYDPDVVLEEVAEFPDSDTYAGVEGMQRWLDAGMQTFDEVRWEPRDFTTQGPHVIVDAAGFFRGGGSGAEVTLDVTHVFTIRDGRIVRVRGFLNRDQALEAVSTED